MSLPVSSWWTTHWRQSSPSEVNFLIFTPAWSLLALIPLLLIPLRFSHLLNTPAGRYGLFALESLTMLYWFTGFVALSVFLSDRICFGMVCDIARASAGVSAFSWLAWAASFVGGIFEWMKTRRAGGGEVMVKKELEMHQGV